MQKNAPDFSLENKVTFVTGASRGIGRACALACAAAGSDIVLGVRDVAAAAGLVAELEGTGRKVLPVQLHIPDKDHITQALHAALTTFGRIDILVNNVGVAPGNLAELVEEKDLDEILDVNIKGTFLMTQAVAREMIKRNSGRIINISSQAGTVALRGEAIYCMSKAAINHLTRCLAAEWARYNITVNTVSPTFIHTDGTAPFLSDPDNHKATLDHIPLGRIGETDDVVGAVVFLASPAASLITGANLLVDGGWSVA
ncbi:SDR family NAD(P)-dependent oxidoreductase [Neorhizobium sp. P12A]|uniref:SDR family NAD(P)-dependent oxidoreductase n=1 Tax=Rhizobium/Agrobacterium group TaxID=227290 RepID=UPI00104C14CE|nr:MULTISPECIES: glucose 1-dehydrogenase [Rhizobium/Agrobacterium group]KAA0697750.1 SDR family NAD(P)-dependent oxidoreductase [Neorhizobium sp. P12A]TCR83884.1 NAD(P)-dependent dehydrogenase (short-subunit alcohol dehydrogenase family) [Rhizobium sp. BK376]